MTFLITFLAELLKKLPPTVVKKAIDSVLDIVEDYLHKDGLTAWEKIIISGCKWLREQLDIVEKPGSPYAD